MLNFTSYLLKAYKTMKRAQDERGSTFILVLIFLLLGSIIIVPTLSFTGTGLLTGTIYEDKTQNLYAVDAGVEDGIWDIKYDEMQSFPTYDPLAYYAYDSNNEWTYTLAEEVNNSSIDVTIQNIWIPSNISAPSPAQALNIIESEKLVVSGTRNATNDSYKIHIIFTPENPVEKENLKVDSIGVYLPPGYQYVTGSSNLEEDPLALWYSVPTVQDYGSNQMILWSGFGSLKFEDLPPLGSTETATITFDYVSTTDDNLKAVSWIKTSGVADIPFSWDNNHSFFHINSSNGNAEVESYVLMPGVDDLSIYDGALVSGGDIYLKKDSTVNGNIILEGTFTTSEPFTHNDGEIVQMDLELPSQEENDNYASGVKREAQSYYSYPGTYFVPIGNGVDITDLGPIYISGDLHIAKDNIINFTGPIYVEGSIDMDKDVEFTGGGEIIAVSDIYLAKTNDFGSDADSIIMSLSGNIVFKKEVILTSLVYAPCGNVQFDMSAEITGSIIASGNIQADKDGTFTQNYDYNTAINLPGYEPDAITPITWELD